MKLIVGLGNIGRQYAQTRHNVGFMVVDQLAADQSVSWKLESKMKAEIAVIDGNEKIILVKPQTMMNLSGEAIQRIMQFYKIDPTDVWVVFDDVDTPFGRMRIRRGGGSSGHQGVKSTITHVGEDFLRLKVGISLNDRTIEPSEVYVLKPFNPDEQAVLPELIEAAVQTITNQLILADIIDQTITLIA